MRTTRFAASLSLAALAAASTAARTPTGDGRLAPESPPITVSVSPPSPATAAANALLKGTAPFSLARGGVATLSLTKWFSLTVTLGGASYVPVNSYGYLYSSVSGGTAPYTYCWYRNDQGIGCGSSSGQNPYFWATGTEYFRVDVTDANNQTGQSNQFFVHVY